MVVMPRKPQFRGRIIRLLQLSPRKPNSAKRKAARVRLVNGSSIFIKITGGGEHPSKFAIVLICGSGYRDTPYVSFRLVRGALEGGSCRRKRRRFKYG